MNDIRGVTGLRRDVFADKGGEPRRKAFGSRLFTLYKQHGRNVLNSIFYRNVKPGRPALGFKRSRMETEGGER
jgi:hypothetical protein